MTKRIFRTVFLVAVGMFLASALLFMTVLYDYFSSLQQNQMRIQADLAAQGVEGGGAAYLEGLAPGPYRITWIDAGGSVLYDSASTPGGMENHLAREEVQQALGQGYGASARTSATLTERCLYSAKRLPDGTVLRLSATQSSLLVLTLGMLQPVAVLFILAVAVSMFLADRLSKSIVKPLNQLDLDCPQAGQGYGELAPLLQRIGSQQQQLKQQQAALVRKQAELELAGQARREFTANVSHELKTPLQSISGYAELLQNGMVKEEDIAPFAGRIYREAQRMVGLVEDIISLSHLDEGAGDMHWAQADLYGIAAQAVSSLAAEAEAAGVEVALEGGPAALWGVPPLLYSIAYNLCGNAIKYNRPGGRVEVRVEAAGGGAALSVSDTGIGIPPSEQGRIFERFYRVDKSRSKAVGGTGLGLSIVKHAVMVHQGEIALRSQPGEGTVVTVTLHPSCGGRG